MFYLYAKVTSINIVAKEEVLRRSWRPSDFEQLHEVIELAMDVATY